VKTLYKGRMPDAPTVDFILQQHSFLSRYFGPRNKEYKVLRDIFRGDFAAAQEAKVLPGIFNDRIEIFYNLINAIVRRQMDSMSQPPRVECLPRGIEEADQRLADGKTKLLDRVYKENRMSVRLLHAAFYQALLDKAVLHAKPDPSMPSGVAIDVAIPESYMPMPAGSDWMCHPFIIYGYKSFDPLDVKTTKLGIDNGVMQFEHNVGFHDTVIYWDAKWYVEVKDGVEQLRIRHDFGSMPWHLAHNIPIPHQFRGQGDGDQSVGLNAYLNRLISNEAQIIDYAANPIVVFRNVPDGTALPFQPRAKWFLGREGQAQFLQWGGTPPAVEAQRLWTQQAVEDLSGVNSAAFGRDLPSGISGTAQRSLLSGYNSRIGTKQTLLGDALQGLNESILMIQEKLYGGKEYEVLGEDRVGGKFGMKVKPKDFGGWYENVVIFEPFDPTTRFFQELEKMDRKIQSRHTTRRNLGVRNPAEEMERIRLEQQEDLANENNMSKARSGEWVPENGNPLDFSDIQLPAGAPGAGGQPPPRESAAAARQGYEPMPGTPDQSAAAPPAKSRADLAEAAAKLGGEGRFKGNVALLNDPAAGGPAEVMLEDPSDEEEVRRLLGGVGAPLKFSVGRAPAEARLLFRGARPKAEPGRAPERVPGQGFLLGVVVVAVERLRAGALVAEVAVKDGSSLMVIGKTEAARNADLQEDDAVMVTVASARKRGEKWTVSKMRLTGEPAAEVSTVADLEAAAGEGA
jgi:hypothetical protein